MINSGNHRDPIGNEVDKMDVDEQSSEEEIGNETAGAHSLLLLQATKREKRLGLRQSYPIIWIGDLFLQNFEVRVEIRLVHGDPAIFKDSEPISLADYPGIHVRKKLKFDDALQKYINQKIQAKEGSCVLIALPLEGDAMQWKRLQNQFIYYFNQQEVIGVSEFSQDEKAETDPGFAEPKSEEADKTDDKLSCGRETIRTSTATADKKFVPKQLKYEMLLFPPSKFVHRNILPVAPKLTELLYKDQIPHLMLVISNDFYCLRCAQISEEKIQDTRNYTQ